LSPTGFFFAAWQSTLLPETRVMSIPEDEVAIAVLDRADFRRAIRTVRGFEQWASYEDYRMEREGRLVGLGLAGQKARLAPVSLDRFLCWSRSTGRPPHASLLDAFSAEQPPAASLRGRGDEDLPPDGLEDVFRAVRGT
jgi:hypothetical protein